jgi:long-subunit fatty acid transport protein
MKKTPFFSDSKLFLILIAILINFSVLGQQVTPAPKSEFWQKVRFGGGLGLNFGNNTTSITVAPSAVYDVNQYVSVGLGVQGSYVSYKDSYKSYIYGGSLIGLINPIEQVQLSAEFEQLRVNTTFDSSFSIPARRNWNTALFLGAGYRTNNITIGARYNVLYKETDNVYGQAFMPFVRVYF